MQVLIVDDVSEVRAMLANLLLGAGIHKVHQAKDGRAAMQSFENYQYDAVFLDIYLPDINGLSLLTDFLQRSPETKIFVCTGQTTIENMKQALENGASGFIVKPFSTQKVLAVISGLFDDERNKR